MIGHHACGCHWYALHTAWKCSITPGVACCVGRKAADGNMAPVEGGGVDEAPVVLVVVLLTVSCKLHFECSHACCKGFYGLQ